MESALAFAYDVGGPTSKAAAVINEAIDEIAGLIGKSPDEFEAELEAARQKA